jgi:predicted outer membrane lipoprotein
MSQSEIEAQQAVLTALWLELQAFRNKRARKSRAYRELEQRFTDETAIYDALVAAAKPPKE